MMMRYILSTCIRCTVTVAVPKWFTSHIIDMQLKVAVNVYYYRFLVV